MPTVVNSRCNARPLIDPHQPPTLTSLLLPPTGTNKLYRDAFMSGDQEPWFFRGGLQAEFQVRILACDQDLAGVLIIWVLLSSSLPYILSCVNLVFRQPQLFCIYIPSVVLYHCAAAARNWLVHRVVCSLFTFTLQLVTKLSFIARSNRMAVEKLKPFLGKEGCRYFQNHQCLNLVLNSCWRAYMGERDKRCKFVTEASF